MTFVLETAMDRKVRNFLDKTPNADFEDVMFAFPELTMNEAYQAVRKHRFIRVLRRWWLVLVVIAAVTVIVLLRR